MTENKTLRITFIVSLLGHSLFLGMPGWRLNLSDSQQDEELVVQVEIVRPAVLPRIERMGEEKKLKPVEKKPDVAEKEPQPQPQEIVIEQPVKEKSEETIDVLDPAREAMLRYQDMVRQRIEQARRYPPWAKRQGIEGAVHLNFKVLSGGLSEDILVVSSSGAKILDEEAVTTIRRANPFPPIPQEINQSSVAIEVIIVFALN